MLFFINIHFQNLGADRWGKPKPLNTPGHLRIEGQVPALIPNAGESVYEGIQVPGVSSLACLVMHFLQS